MTPEQRLLIESTLRNMITVQDDGGDNILMGQPAFWARCHSIPLDTEFYFVDGYVGACKWNCLQVRNMYPGHELQVFQGYALSNLDGRWLEHCWLMTGDRLVETTGAFVLYYGAALDPEELDVFEAFAGQYNPEQHAHGQFWMTLGPGRFMRPIEDGMFQLGKMRRASGEILDDLFG